MENRTRDYRFGRAGFVYPGPDKDDGMKHDYTKGPLQTGPKRPFMRHSGPITDIVVHYLWTLPTNRWDMAKVAHLHTVKNGWNGPGYHFLVRRNGSVEYGRPVWARGAHVRGKNDRKLGVVFEGGRLPGSQDGHNTMTDIQERAVIALIRDLKRDNPNAEVNGHRDHVATQCPGFDVSSWWIGHPVLTVKKDAPATVTPNPPAPGWVTAFVEFLRSLFKGGNS